AGLNGDVVGTGARLIGEDARLTGGGKGVTGDGAEEVDADGSVARPRIDSIAGAPAIKVAGESPVAIDDDGAAGRRRANGVVLCFDEAICGDGNGAAGGVRVNSVAGGVRQITHRHVRARIGDDGDVSAARCVRKDRGVAGAPAVDEGAVAGDLDSVIAVNGDLANGAIRAGRVAAIQHSDGAVAGRRDVVDPVAAGRAGHIAEDVSARRVDLERRVARADDVAGVA